MLGDYLRLAVSNLRKRRLRSWLTMIGIFIGIAAVVSLISLGQGMERAITEEFFQLGADKLQVVVKGPTTGPPGSNSDITLTEADLQVVQRANGVEVAGGRLIEPIRVRYNDVERFLYVASLPEDPDERALVEEISDVQAADITRGRLLDEGDVWKVMMSEQYYDEPRFDGETLKVGDKLEIGNQTVEVVGFFARTGNPLVDMTFVMNEEPIRELLDIPEKYGVIGAEVEEGANISLVAEAVEKDLRRHRGLDEGDEDFNVNTAEDVLDTLTTVLGAVTAVLIGIASISLLVGGLGIMNTMYTAVLERRREIGIMKAIGARNRDVMLVFLIESSLLGLVGGTIGILLGVGLSLGVQAIATAALGTVLIQASFPWYLIVGALAFSVGVGAAAGTFPARQASRMQPVEALQQ